MPKMLAPCAEDKASATTRFSFQEEKTTMTQTRQAGILLHITSLPEGQLGQEAYRFVDILAEMGVSVWQTLPVNMPHGDQSPYQSVSAHAGHPGMISVSLLASQGWCTPQALALPLPALISQVMLQVEKADHPYAGGLNWPGFLDFCQKNGYWLNDFSLFLALREQYQAQSWDQWSVPLRQREAAALAEFSALHARQLQLIKFTQYVFFEQWAALKRYANQKGVLLFGDIPIFVAYDSADVWAHPDWFKLDTSLQMTVVAGVPPDYFSETGQRWGNPHYNWPVMQADGFHWWLGRVAAQSSLFDILRIDHFRGLQAAWEIPASEPTAINGEWQEAPGTALLQAITTRFPDLQLVAEDLGIITPEVDAMRHAFDLPGMKILQFAFGGGEDNPYLPAQIEVNSVAYTGTHDNDTTLGWYQAAPEHVKTHLQQYLALAEPEMPQALIRLTLQSVARLAVIPMQDILALDSHARMNTPGTIEGNWSWRMQWTQLRQEHIQQFKTMVKESGRADA